MMTFINAFSGNAKPLPREAAQTYVLLLAPFAPYLREELWERGAIVIGPDIEAATVSLRTRAHPACARWSRTPGRSCGKARRTAWLWSPTTWYWVTAMPLARRSAAN